MISTSRTIRDTHVGIATLNGRAYYFLTRLMNEIGIPHIGFTPSDQVARESKLTLTTKGERELVQSNAVITLEDLGTENVSAKEKIIAGLYGRGDDRLLVGMDPGKRIGLVAYFGNHEIYAGVLVSVSSTVEKVARIIRGSGCSKKIVRIGYGSPIIGGELVRKLLERVSDIDIEIVDESGTSSLTKSKLWMKGTRDQKSARIIAFRIGKKYLSDWKE